MDNFDIFTATSEQFKQASYITALRENPANGVSTDNSPLPAGDHTQLWAPGRTLKIGFTDVRNERTRQAIIDLGSQWLNHANLTFEFTDNGVTDLRISQRDSSCVTRGTDGLLAPQNKPNMFVFAYIKEGEEPSDWFTHSVLRAFARALGATDEEQHPEANIPWDLDKVDAYFEQRHGWTAEQTRTMINEKVNIHQVNGKPYDRNSVMHRDIPNEVTIGNFRIVTATQISAGDIEFMNKAYPF